MNLSHGLGLNKTNVACGLVFVVEDGNLVTARWPGDAQGFADSLLALIRARAGGPSEIECPTSEEPV